MYRRIELINHYPHKDEGQHDFKAGLCYTFTTDLVCDAWLGLHVPRKRIHKNVRFYFTEAGWRKFGRATVEACQKSGQDYRVLAVEEHTMDVYYKDEYQVCLRPKRKQK